jgi:outer membrane receptor protein involved in Fe transport
MTYNNLGHRLAACFRWDGVFGSDWLIETSFARAQTRLEELPSVNSWRIRDFRATPTIISGGIGFFEQNDGENLQYELKSTNLFSGHQVKYGILFEDVSWNQGSNRTGPTFLSPDGRQTATGAQVQIRSDPAFGQIFRVDRANFNVTRPTEQNYFAGFVQDSWRATDRLTINAGVRYEQQTLLGTIRDLVLFDPAAAAPGFIGASIDDSTTTGRRGSGSSMTSSAVDSRRCSPTTAGSTRACRTTWRRGHSRPTRGSRVPTSSTPT